MSNLDYVIQGGGGGGGGGFWEDWVLKNKTKNLLEKDIEELDNNNR